MSIKIKISIIAICFALVAAVCIGFVFASPNETVNMNGMINYEVPKITITASPNDSNLGSTNGSGDYSIGDTINLSATRSGSNSFLAWATSKDPKTMEILSTSTTYSFELTEDSPTTYYALFNSTTSSQPDGNLVYTFYNEAKLAEITGRDSSFQGGDYTISPTVTSGENSYKVYSIGGTAFSGCSSLTSITIPEGVTSIGANAFNGCSGLTSIKIPEGVSEIGFAAFSRCSSLTSITIPEGVTSIGSLTFRDCSNLTSIKIPEGVTSIGYNAFYRCSGLTQITINGNISTLRSNAFISCTNLTKLTLGAGVTSIPSNLFTGSNLINLNEIVVLGNLRSTTFPSGNWYKNGSKFTIFSGAGTYTKS